MQIPSSDELTCSYDKSILNFRRNEVHNARILHLFSDWSIAIVGSCIAEGLRRPPIFISKPITSLSPCRFADCTVGIGMLYYGLNICRSLSEICQCWLCCILTSESCSTVTLKSRSVTLSRTSEQPLTNWYVLFFSSFSQLAYPSSMNCCIPFCPSNPLMRRLARRSPRIYLWCPWHFAMRRFNTI